MQLVPLLLAVICGAIAYVALYIGASVSVCQGRGYRFAFDSLRCLDTNQAEWMFTFGLRYHLGFVVGSVAVAAIVFFLLRKKNA